MAVRIHELLSYMVKNKASDLHLAAGEVPAVRIDGDIQRLGNDKLSNDDAKRLVYSVMNEKQKATFENRLELDFSIGLKGLARFRVNAFVQTRGVAMVLRSIPTDVLSLEDLDLPKIFRKIANYSSGMVLVTGPTGSGKSTTLAAVIDHINKNRAEHILTIEDPVEFIHRPNKCLINQREVGTHTKSFTDALRSALREDPDVILVGELRDLETIQLAMTAAETGHLVFGTLHTNSAPETIDRIIEVFPHEKQQQVRTMVSASLRAVVSQKLLRPQNGVGRIAAHEIMVCNAAIKNLIRENKLHQIASIMQTGKGDGMVTMADTLRALHERGKLSKQQAIMAANDPKLFDDPIGDMNRAQNRRRRS